MSWSSYKKRVHEYPLRMVVADLMVSGLGVAIMLAGGYVSVAGFHPKPETGDLSANPGLGQAIVTIGLVVVGLGLALVLFTAVVYLTGLRHGRHTPVDEFTETTDPLAE
jgi:hypothetical protein